MAENSREELRDRLETLDRSGTEVSHNDAEWIERFLSQTYAWTARQCKVIEEILERYGL